MSSTPGSSVSSLSSLTGRTLVSLNVGGKCFKTSLATLQKEHSFLSVLLNGSWGENEQDSEIFIDRDGSRFVHVLNYLRDGKLNVDDYDRAKRESPGCPVDTHPNTHPHSRLKM